MVIIIGHEWSQVVVSGYIVGGGVHGHEQSLKWL